ncbi:MAG: GAF domain-containing protein [Deltaproteobacteria bacterium]|nr:GAF domain-containing protein [Deltaproteobacteria bacterium]
MPAQRFAKHPIAAYEAALEDLARLPVDERRSLVRMFQQATRLIASTLSVERVGIWLYEHERTHLRLVCQYARARDAYRADDVLLEADFPVYFRALRDYRAIVADDARTHPLTSELAAAYLVPNAITSMLDAPLVRHGEVVGVVCHEHVGPLRTWTPSETSFVASVADLVAVAMEQAAHIEARRALEETARRAGEEQRMAALGRVAAAVGHDFGHLLTMVLSHAQEILAVPDLPVAAKSHAAAVVDTINRSRELTRQLAELGRNGDTPAAAIALDTSVATAADFLRAMPRQGQRIDLALGAAGARVRFEPTQLDQVLMNLVNNALDATGEGSTIRIATSLTDEPGDGRMAVLRVTDDGAGIDDETKTHIFEPYFTTKGGAGTGLGLAIVHALVERAGGFIHVESASGKGTSVELHLPLAA